VQAVRCLVTCRIRFTTADQPDKFLRMHIIAVAVGGILLRHRVGAAVSDRLSLLRNFGGYPALPASAPIRAAVSTIAPTTFGCCAMPR